MVMTHGVNLKGTGGCRGRNEALAVVGESTEKCEPERWALRWEVVMDCEGGPCGLMKTRQPWSFHTALHQWHEL